MASSWPNLKKKNQIYTPYPKPLIFPSTGRTNFDANRRRVHLSTPHIYYLHHMTGHNSTNHLRLEAASPLEDAAGPRQSLFYLSFLSSFVMFYILHLNENGVSHKKFCSSWENMLKKNAKNGNDENGVLPKRKEWHIVSWSPDVGFN